MRISNGQVDKLLEIQLKGSRRASPPKDASGPARHDSVSLSRQAADITRAKELAASAPAVREDKVAPIREAIERGDYRVSPENLADKILSDARLARILRKL